MKHHKSSGDIGLSSKDAAPDKRDTRQHNVVATNTHDYFNQITAEELVLAHENSNNKETGGDNRLRQIGNKSGHELEHLPACQAPQDADDEEHIDWSHPEF